MGENSNFRQGNRPFVGNNTLYGNEVRASTLLVANDVQITGSETVALVNVTPSALPATGPGGTREIPVNSGPCVILNTSAAQADLRCPPPKLVSALAGCMELTIVNASGNTQTWDAADGNVAGGAVAIANNTASKYLFLPGSPDPQADGQWFPLLS